MLPEPLVPAIAGIGAQQQRRRVVTGGDTTVQPGPEIIPPRQETEFVPVSRNPLDSSQRRWPAPVRAGRFPEETPARESHPPVRRRGFQPSRHPGAHPPPVARQIDHGPRSVHRYGGGKTIPANMPVACDSKKFSPGSPCDRQAARLAAERFRRAISGHHEPAPHHKPLAEARAVIAHDNFSESPSPIICRADSSDTGLRFGICCP